VETIISAIESVKALELSLYTHYLRLLQMVNHVGGTALKSSAIKYTYIYEIVILKK